MTLSLIGGKFKGRRLKSPKGSHIRPTTSMVRKAVFDISQAIIEDALFLDLFAGSGAMGLEALSRGAAQATFIDKDLDSVKENVSLLKVEKQSTLLRGDALLLLKKLKNPFDIIYVDPPYERVPLTNILTLIDEKNLLREGGILFFEEPSPSKEKWENVSLNHLVHKDTRRFGKALLHQYTTVPN